MSGVGRKKREVVGEELPEGWPLLAKGGLSKDILYPVQRRVIETAAFVRVVIAGRGGGKSTLETWWVADGMTRGMPCLYVAPTAQQYEQADTHLKSLFRHVMESGENPGGRISQRTMRKDKRFLDRQTGGRIDLRSGKLPANLRSGGYPRVVIDEADYQHARVVDTLYGAMGRSEVAGEVMVGTTPMDLPQASWVERDFQRGQAGDKGFAAFQWTAWDVPHTSKKSLVWMRGGRTDDYEGREWCGGDRDAGLQAGGVPRDVYEREVLARYVTARGVQLQREWVEAARAKGREEWAGLAVPAGHKNPKMAVSIGIDSAFSTSSNSDRTVAATVGRDRAGNLWILDAGEGRGGLDTHVKIGVQLIVRWVPMRGTMEARGDVDLAVQALEREISRELGKMGLEMRLPLTARRPEEDKKARFAEVERAFRAGQARVHPDCPGWLLEELLAFPSKGHHDDGVDAVSIATLMCPYAPVEVEAPYADQWLMEEIERSRRRGREGAQWGLPLSLEVM